MTGNALVHVPGSDDLVQLSGTYPDWAIWASDAGRWYATRRTFLADRVRRFGLWETVHAESLAFLERELRQQAERGELAASIFGTLA